MTTGHAKSQKFLAVSEMGDQFCSILFLKVPRTNPSIIGCDSVSRLPLRISLAIETSITLSIRNMPIPSLYRRSWMPSVRAVAITPPSQNESSSRRLSEDRYCQSHKVCANSRICPKKLEDGNIYIGLGKPIASSQLRIAQ